MNGFRSFPRKRESRLGPRFRGDECKEQSTIIRNNFAFRGGNVASRHHVAAKTLEGSGEHGRVGCAAPARGKRRVCAGAVVGMRSDRSCAILCRFRAY